MRRYAGVLRLIGGLLRQLILEDWTVSDWIRPRRVMGHVDEATHVVVCGPDTYAVARATINADLFDPAFPVAGSLQLQSTQGPFEIGHLSVGKILHTDGFQVEADWYFRLH